MTSIAKFMFDTEFETAETASGAPENKLMTGSDLQALRDSAFADGVNEGIAQENRTTENRHSQALAAIANGLGIIAGNQAASMDRTIDDATNLTVMIARKLSPALSTHQSLVGIELILRDFLHQLIDEPRIVVRVPEALIDELKRRIDEISTDCGFSGRIVLMPDPSLNGNDCRLEWADGGVTRCTEAILDEIENGVVRMLTNPAALSGDDPQNEKPAEPSGEQSQDPDQPAASLGSSQ